MNVLLESLLGCLVLLAAFGVALVKFDEFREADVFANSPFYQRISRKGWLLLGLLALGLSANLLVTGLRYRSSLEANLKRVAPNFYSTVQTVTGYDQGGASLVVAQSN